MNPISTLISKLPQKKEGHYCQGKYYDDYEDYNSAIDACTQALKKCKMGVDGGKIASVIQLRYFKLMCPDITEADAKIVADVLATALSQAEIIKVEKI